MPSRVPLRFTPHQNKLITGAITALSLVVFLGITFYAVMTGLQLLNRFVHIIGPVIVGFFLSILTKPWYLFIKKHLHIRNEIAAIAVFSVSLLLPLVIIGWLFGSFIVSQVANLITSFPDIAGKVWASIVDQTPALRDMLQRYGIEAMVTDFLKSFPENQSAQLIKNLGTVGGVLLHFGVVAAMWCVTPIYWGVFLMRPPLSGQQIASRLPFLSPAVIRPLGQRIQSFIEIMVSYFHGQLLDALIQAVLYALGFWIVGLSYGIPVGFALGFLNMIPYLGNAIGLSVAIPLALFGAGGGPMLLVAILIVFVIIQTVDGYFILPCIQGNRMKLEAWVIIFAILFWTSIGGFLGLLLAVPLTAFIKLIWVDIMRYSRKLINAREKNFSEGDSP